MVSSLISERLPILNIQMITDGVNFLDLYVLVAVICCALFSYTAIYDNQVLSAAHIHVQTLQHIHF